MRFRFTKILILCFILSFFCLPSFFCAGQEEPSFSVADRWFKNAKELEQSVKNLYAINSLLAQENRDLTDQISRMEDQERQLTDKLQALKTKKINPPQASILAPENTCSPIDKPQETVGFSFDEKMIHGAIDDVRDDQEKLRTKAAQLKEEISRLEQDNFLQQRQDKELSSRFKEARFATQSFLDSKMTAQREAVLLLATMNLFVKDAYKRLDMLSAQEKKLEKDLADQKAMFEKPETISDERDALVAQLVMLQVKNENLKNDLAAQRKGVRVPERLIVSPSIESLTTVFKIQSEENMSLKKEFSRLSQSLCHLEKQIKDIEKTLQKK